MNRTFFNGTEYKRPTHKSVRRWVSNQRRVKRYGDEPDFNVRHTYPGLLILESWQSHDEGYHFRAVEIDFDAGTACVVSGGSDCDGPISTTTDLDWNASTQQWEKYRSRVYDQFAQAAGY